jgi:hypothetical protein
MDIFLRARHWQLFLLTFALPVVFQMVMIGIMVAKMIDYISTDTAPDALVMYGCVKYVSIGILLHMGFSYGWFWSVAIGMQERVPSEVKMNVLRFKISFFVPLVFLVFVFSFVRTMVGRFIEGGEVPHPGMILLCFAILIPLHLFSMVCAIHTMYFTAKTFKTVEMQKEVEFMDFIAEFFLIWFYPVGIWIIQPKINKMVEE